MDDKAQLLHEHYCDGLGDCLPACPMDAISFEMREAPAYDEAAVLAAKAKKELPQSAPAPSRLQNFPVQLKLVAPNAPWLADCHLLIAADCTAYAYGNFHQDFIRGKTVLIGCPKLDGVDYAQKLEAIFASQNIQSVTVTRMQVPCCGGLDYAVRRAIAASGKDIPLQVVTISPDGEIL